MKTKKITLQLVGIANKSHEKDGIPIFLSPVSAGFPSPADDYIENKLDLHDYLVRNDISTFFLRATGDSMTGVSINDGDLLVVDRSIEPTHNKIVIAALEGELVVKRLVKKKDRVYLQSENPDYPDFDITESEDVHIWGVVAHTIHSF